MPFPEPPVPAFPPYPASRVHAIDPGDAGHNQGEVCPNPKFDSTSVQGDYRGQIDQDEDHQKQPGSRIFPRGGVNNELPDSPFGHFGLAYANNARGSRS